MLGIIDEKIKELEDISIGTVQNETERKQKSENYGLQTKSSHTYLFSYSCMAAFPSPNRVESFATGL